MIWCALTRGPPLLPPPSKLRPRRKAASVRQVTQILVIEDDGATRDLLRQVLSDEGYELLLVDRLERAATDAAPELVITDLVGLDRYASARARASVLRVQERYPATPILVCTGYEHAAEEPDRLGAAAVLRKPFAIEALVQVVGRLVAH
jgi:two-component system, NtrC family, nitrogen regulation response regulator NtrX